VLSHPVTILVAGNIMAKKINPGQSYSLKKDITIPNSTGTKVETFPEGTKLQLLSKTMSHVKLHNSDYGSDEWSCNIDKFIDSI